MPTPIVYITFISNIVLFLNILFKCNTLLTYKSKNIRLIIGMIFSAFLGPGENLQVVKVQLQCVRLNFKF